MVYDIYDTQLTLEKHGFELRSIENKSSYKWTHVVEAYAVQGSTVLCVLERLFSHQYREWKVGGMVE